MIRNSNKGGIIGPIIGVATLALVAVAIYFVVKGFIWFIFAFAWAFLLIAAIVDYKVIVNFGKRLVDLFKRQPLYGVGAVALSAIFYPFVFFVLMMRSLLGKMVKRINVNMPGYIEPEEEVFVEYEELEEESLDLREVEHRKREL